ncbi:MAG TPA: DUF885 family protein [Acidimicrobiales bacterium]|nr:DUF885 family protein [Acidimicrobiales bacterium]
MTVPEAREYAGLHEYDGEVLDLSPGGVRASVTRLGGGDPDRYREPDAHDEAHLLAAEAGLRAGFELAEQHRWNPLVHIENLDLAVYDREYAPAAERAEARRRHLARWPDAVDASLESLDRMPAPVAKALVGGAEGLATGVDDEAALDALARLVRRFEQASSNGPAECALGGEVLARLLGDPEGMPVDLARLEERADLERDRLRARLAEDCDRYRRGAGPAELVPELLADHPDDDGIYENARRLIGEITAFVLERDLIPDPKGTCLVGPAPASRRWAMAMMSPGGAYEAEAPGWYYVNPPDPAWSDQEKAEWRSVFSATTLPAITAHEVTPGHFAHQRIAMQLVRSDVRKSLASAAFVEGWAHYGEELLVEEGFRRDDPRYAIGVWLEALLRVTRLACALGIHRGTMTVEEATRRFEQDAFLKGPAALAEANRGTYDPTYGRYTWGKLEIRALRDEAMATWGTRYSHRRFHEALLGLGCPPLGTLGDALLRS